MKVWIKNLMETTRPGILRNRPNKLARGITAGIYTGTQKYKKKGVFELSDVATLSLYGTLDFFRNWKDIFIAKTRENCPCCGHTVIKQNGLSKAGKARLNRLRAKRQR